MRFNNFLLAFFVLAFSASFSNGASVVSSQVVPGTVFIFAGPTCPAGSIGADGTSLLRSGYVKLFAAIGTGWGTADGTHFNAPDLRGIVPRGIDNGSNRDPDKASRTAITTGGNSGNLVGSYQDDMFKSHTHSETGGGPGFFPAGGSSGNFAPATTGATGGNETRMKNAYVTYCVKY